jgi:microcystin-dependent protein
MPIHQGSGYAVGQAGGEASHTLTVAEMPPHTHLPTGVATATGASPAGSAWASAPLPAYGSPVDSAMSAAAVANAGGSQPHENRPPYLVLGFVIALVGIFPSRN